MEKIIKLSISDLLQKIDKYEKTKNERKVVVYKKALHSRLKLSKNALPISRKSKKITKIPKIMKT